MVKMGAHVTPITKCVSDLPQTMSPTYTNIPLCDWLWAGRSDDRGL